MAMTNGEFVRNPVDSWANLFAITAPNNGQLKQSTNWFTLPGAHYCGPGGAGTPTNRVDSACYAHDLCYQNAGVSFLNNIGLASTTPQQQAAIQACDSALSTAISNISWPTSSEMGLATIVSTYFNLPSGYSLNPNLPSVPIMPRLPFPAF